MYKRNRIGKYSADEHKELQKNRILELIENHKLREAKRIINEELRIFKNDKLLRGILLYCNFLEKNYEEVLAYNKDLERKNVIIITISAIKLNDNEKLKYLYEKYFRNYIPCYIFEKSNEENYRMLKYYLTKEFESELEVPDIKMTYREKMVWDYNEEEAISYIISNYCNYKSNRNVMFIPNIDIKELFETVQKSIELNKGNEIITKQEEKYIFYLPGCGFEKKTKQPCDYLEVSTTINTNNVINIVPSSKPAKGLYYSISKLSNPKYETQQYKSRVKEQKKVNI